MKVNRLGEHFSTLEQSQMKEIDRLQEQIKLLEFDRTKDRQKIRELNLLITRRNETLKNVIADLDTMRVEDNFKNILYAINILRIISREVEDE